MATTAESLGLSAPAEASNDRAAKLGLTAPAAPEMMTRTERFGTGMKDPVIGSAQLTSKIPGAMSVVNWLRRNVTGKPEISTQDVGRAVQAREADIKSTSPQGTDWWRVGGNVASSLPLAPLNPVLAGTVMGATQPVTSPDFWTQKTLDTGLGAATGKAGDLLGKIVAPRISDAAKSLIQRGVKLTPGEIMGGEARTAEEAWRSMPFLGKHITAAEKQSLESFNRSLYNDVLEPVGMKYAGTEPIGREGMDKVAGILGDKYDTLSPTLTFRGTPEWASDLNKIGAKASTLTEENQKLLKSIFKAYVSDKLGSGGTLTGQEFKNAESELSAEMRGYIGAKDNPQYNKIGKLLQETVESMRDNLARTNPHAAAELKKLNESYARYLTMRNASIRRPSSGGVFSPSDLTYASKGMDRTAGKGRFARGKAMFQEEGENASEVMAAKLRDSGTPIREAWRNPGAIAMGAAGAPVYRAMNSPAGRALLAGAPKTRGALRPIIQRAPLAFSPAIEDAVNPPLVPGL